jgi:hypothetical protein
VDTQYADNGQPSVGWITNGEWLEYSIRVDSSWLYQLSMRVATLYSRGGPISILVNGEERLSGIEIPGTGAWDSFITYRPGSLRLNAEDTILRLQFDKGGFNLGRLRFTPASTNALENQGLKGLGLYPNPAQNRLWVSNEHPLASWQILDLTGREVLGNGRAPGQGPVDISMLSPGHYLFIARDREGRLLKGRFSKAAS